MAELVKAGKVRYLGLSRGGPRRRMRRAHAVHPITRAADRVLAVDAAIRRTGSSPTCRELGIGFVAYSPLGRGFLTGQIKTFDDLARGRLPPAHARASRARTSRRTSSSCERIEAIAAQKGCTPAQLALAWVLAQGDDIVPIPGTKRSEYLEENVAAVSLELTSEDLHVLDEAAPAGAVSGDRYPTRVMHLIQSS